MHSTNKKNFRVPHARFMSKLYLRKSNYFSVSKRLFKYSSMPRRKKHPCKSHRVNETDTGTQNRGNEASPSDGQRPRKNGWDEIDKNNEKLFDYYKGIDLVPENEWDDFVNALRRPLPTTFRVTGIRSQAKEMVKMMQGKYFHDILDLSTDVDGKVIEPPAELQWYPDSLGWQVNIPRMTIRKLPELRRFHKFLIAETESGNISRQEAVSMIPPLLLDVKSHHRILDMCAAPGSKTAQLIELLHADESNPTPEGFVIANDVDNKRCYMMVHQIKRIQSPCFMVVNHDAANFPKLIFGPNGEQLLFDRVLADVPCSGDGTIRKNADIWFKWHSLLSCNLHNIQRSIFKRGIDNLADGGKIVYSTCSMNPVEDEAVIASVLKERDDLTLVDVSGVLLGLKRIPGLKTWKLQDRSGRWMSSIEDVPENLKTVCLGTMFPPTIEEASSMHLERCVRLLPHHQDTGGFFIAVLEKKSEVIDCSIDKSSNLSQSVGDDNCSNVSAESDVIKTGLKRPVNAISKYLPVKKRQKGYTEDEIFYLNKENDIWPPIKEFFDISDDFPYTQLLYRGDKTDKKRNLYFTSKAIQNIIMINGSKIRFINLGLRMFTRNENEHVKCGFRIAQDGILQLLPYFTRRIVKLTYDQLTELLGREENPFIDSMPGMRQKVEELGQGCVVFHYEHDDQPNVPHCKLFLCGWLGKTSLRLFVDKHDRQHYMRLCGKDIQDLEKPAEDTKVDITEKIDVTMLENTND